MSMQEPTSSENASVERLLMECLDRIESQGIAAVEEVCRAHPEHAAAIRRKLERLHEAGLLELPSGTRTEPGLPERVGDFHLLRTLGGGGMGVVYLARQEGLGREVAVKVIRPDHLFFADSRARFRREVETVARLQHPGIVQVHTVGEEQGLPWFAMERVRGCTLADVLAEHAGGDPARLAGADFAAAVARRTADPEPALPAAEGPPFSDSWERTVLAIGRHVAEALDHAHRRGILHRDVKPSNVMVTPGGRVLLVDFGLAASAEPSGLTRTGTRLGSLSYMAPEQAAGEFHSLGPETDVWSLGVTLYELLALRPAFHHTSAAGLLAAVSEGHTTPLRRWNRALSWEAETVVAKAMEPDRRRRYPDAAAFARDLTRVLEHRPIEARRPGPIRRIRRFVQRRPAGALAIAVLLLLGAGVPAVVVAWQGQVGAERARSEANVLHLFDQVDAMISRAGAGTLTGAPLSGSAERELREGALRMLKSFLAQDGSRAELRLETARAQRRVAYVEERLGNLAGAEEAYRAALELVAEALAGAPGDKQAQNERTNCQRSLAKVLFSTGRADDAEATLREALDAADSERAQEPGAVAHLITTGQLRGELGAVLAQRGRLTEAEPLLEDALASLSSARVLAPAAPLPADAEASVRHNLGSLFMTTGRYADAERSYRAALELERGLVESHPDDLDLKDSVATALQSLGLSLLHQDRAAETAAPLAEALALREHLVATFPDVPQQRLRHADLLAVISRGHRAAEDVAAADAALSRTVATYRELIAEFPARVEFAVSLAGYCGNLAILRMQDDPEGARTLLREAIDLLKARIAVDPGVPPLHGQLALTLGALSDHYLETEPATARDLLDEAIQHHEVILHRQPGVLQVARDAITLLANRAWARATLGDLDGAQRDAERIATLAPERFDAWWRAALLTALCAVYAMEQTPPDPIAEARFSARALELLQGAVDRGYRDLEQVRTLESFAPVRALPGYPALEAAMTAAARDP